MQSIFYFVYRTFFTSVSARKFKIVYCPQCGRKTLIFYDPLNLRETGICLFCSASTRYRSMAEIIKREGIGCVAQSIDARAVANMLNKLDSRIIDVYKIRSLELAKRMNAEIEMDKLLAMYQEFLVDNNK